MVLSKLESLPNEILIDIFEKYINGVDILVAFSHQLNRRFDKLLSQCRRHQFDFICCRKDDFRFCVGLMPFYFEKIEELALSERNTPSQIYAFLSFFPSFVPFKQLRQLHFHYDAEAVDPVQIQTALLSLSHTTISSLSIRGINTASQFSLSNVILEIFYIPTLKQFSLAFELEDPNWRRLPPTSSNIEHLTISGVHCQWTDLQFIFRCASKLKYFNVQLTASSYHIPDYFTSPIVPMTDTVPVAMLHTFILYFQQHDLTTFDMLAQCLRSMPSLQRLEISAHDRLIGASAWETLIQTSLPLLTRFNLKTTEYTLRRRDIDEILNSFQSSFWTAKKNFRLMISKNERLYFNSALMNHVRGRRRRELDMSNSLMLGPPVAGWRIALNCALNKDLHMMDAITSLRLSGMSTLPSCEHYLKNVKYLTVDYLSESLFEWITTSIACSSIKELAIFNSEKASRLIISLLNHATNISSLQINLDLSFTWQISQCRKDGRLKCLDLSERRHRFNKEDIIVIEQLFPSIEHLVINTENLNNVPLLKVYMSHLRSLTFKIIHPHFHALDDYQQKLWDYRLRERTQFFFQREANWVTIWIDSAALEESFWQIFAE